MSVMKCLENSETFNRFAAHISMGLAYVGILAPALLSPRPLTAGLLAGTAAAVFGGIDHLARNRYDDWYGQYTKPYRDSFNEMVKTPAVYTAIVLAGILAASANGILLESPDFRASMHMSMKTEATNPGILQAPKCSP